MSKVVPIVLFAVVVIGATAGYFLVLPQQTAEKPPPQASQAPPAIPQPEAPKAPLPEKPPPQDPRVDALRQSVENHLQKFAARDVRSLMEDYIPDKAYAEWGGQAGVFAGRYDGTPNIRILWSQIIGNTVSISYKLLKYDAKIDGDRAEVKYNVFFNGTGKLIGDFEINVDAIQKFVYTGGKWLMDNDLWVFRAFKTSVVADATVFPLHWKKLGDFNLWNERAKDLLSPRRP